jgi:hypothetical protein
MPNTTQFHGSAENPVTPVRHERADTPPVRLPAEVRDGTQLFRLQTEEIQFLDFAKGPGHLQKICLPEREEV